MARGVFDQMGEAGKVDLAPLGDALVTRTTTAVLAEAEKLALEIGDLESGGPV